ncbi:hypothetical protein, partial [Methanosarcina spelaei]|uniref:hypothetical protein n=1 Tax=Methanosarcina spelaei TaxID=1036679 RepID=UPI001BAF494F
MTDKKCFIIMPVTTPPELVSVYNNDSHHFRHVMEHLFIPAVKEAGFEPIKPITEGSDVIHGNIISNLESSDLVLCDMSTNNPNVFFELGIRTALNKPVCLLKDPYVEKVPFDIVPVNYHVYSPDLSTWEVEDEVDKLANHIMKSFSERENCNSFWKYFGTNTQSKEIITQFEETISRSKKEQQIKDIENRLEKFYIPVEDIINGKLKKNHEQTINGWPPANYIGLKDLRKYSYLAEKETYKAYETYIESIGHRFRLHFLLLLFFFDP